MNILFIYSVDDIFLPERPLRTQEEMQFGISYISSLLKRHGHRTQLAVLSRMLGEKSRHVLDDCLEGFRPAMVCFTSVTSEYRFIAKTAGYIKKRYPDLYLLGGGSHISLNPEKVITDDFDALCIGEGEQPTLELVTQLEEKVSPSGIFNLWIKKDAVIEKNPTRPFLQDINSLPFPDREMWQRWISEEAGSRYPVLLGRGCPFQCTYCCNHALRKLAEGPYVRFRSIGNILAEIEDIIATHPERRDFYLEVETIGANISWAVELCSGLESLNRRLDCPLSFGTNLRVTPGADFEKLFAAFRKSNFKFIKIGVESGSERVRRQILRRDYSNQDILNTVKLARRYGLEISFYNIIGVPGETVSDFRETVRINRACLPDKAFVHIFFPYPETDLYNSCAEQGLLKDASGTELERCKATLNLPGFPKGEIQKGFVWFDYYVYKGHMSLFSILAKVFVSKCRSDIRLHHLYRSVASSFFLRRIKSVFKRLV